MSVRSRTREFRQRIPSSSSPVPLRPSEVRFFSFFRLEKLFSGLPSRYSSVSPSIMPRGAVLVMLLPEAFRKRRLLMPMSGLRSLSWL